MEINNRTVRIYSYQFILERNVDDREENLTQLKEMNSLSRMKLF